MYRLLTGITAIFISLQCFACDLSGYRNADQAAVKTCLESRTAESNIWRPVSISSQKRPFENAINHKHVRTSEHLWRNSNHPVETYGKSKNWPSYRNTIDINRTRILKNTAFNSFHDWQLTSLPFSSRHSFILPLNSEPNNRSLKQTQDNFNNRPDDGYVWTFVKRKQLSPANRCHDRLGSEKIFASATQTVALDTQFDVKTHWLLIGDMRGSSLDESFGGFDTNKRFVRNLKPVFIS